MKKALVTLALVLGLSTAAFAGPLLGLSFEPKTPSIASIYFGWQSANDWQATIGHGNLNTWVGAWSFGALWTPALWGDSVNLRVGGTVNFDWDKYGQIQYNGLSLSLGAERWITEMFGIYGQINISSNLRISPLVGLELNFWMPSANEAPSG